MLGSRFSRRMWVSVTVVALVWSLMVLRVGHVYAEESINPIERWWDENIPKEIKTIAKYGKDITGIFSDVSGGITAVKDALKMIGILEEKEVNFEKEFNELHGHLDRLGVALDWKISELNRSDLRAKHYSSIITAKREVARDVLILDNSEAAKDSLDAVLEAADEVQFKRIIEERAIDGKSEWKKIITDWEEHLNRNGDQVYDWRVGVPGLMRHVALRMQVIAAIDPNFKTNFLFQEELLQHRSALLRKYEKMIAGIHCNHRFDDRYEYRS
jgi:hypothetical protein